MGVAERLAKGRFYYGWYLVAIFFISSFLSAGLNTEVLSFFLKPMTQELSWSRGFYSSVVWMGTVIGTPLALVLLPMVDRKGARGVMLVCGAVMGIGVAAQGLVHSEWQFILIRGIIIPLGSVGTGAMMGMLVVSTWFIKKRGRALGWTTMGLASAGVIFPPVATSMISHLGWRGSWMVLGLASLVLNVAMAWFFVRRRPEDMGLLPDGEPAGAQGQGKTGTGATEAAWSRREILRTPAFWVLSLAIPFGFLGFQVIKQHLIPYLTDPGIGFTGERAASIFVLVSLVSLLSKIPWGFVMERVTTIYCFSVCFALFGAGMAVLALSGSNVTGLYAGAILLGLGWGGSLPLQGMVWASYYGRGSQGMARSLATPVANLSGPLGPILAGFVWDLTGDYQTIFAAYAAPSLLCLFVILLARRPAKKPLPAGVAAEGAG